MPRAPPFAPSPPDPARGILRLPRNPNAIAAKLPFHMGKNMLVAGASFRAQKLSGPSSAHQISASFFVRAPSALGNSHKFFSTPVFPRLWSARLIFAEQNQHCLIFLFSRLFRRPDRKFRHASQPAALTQSAEGAAPAFGNAVRKATVAPKSIIAWLKSPGRSSG